MGTNDIAVGNGAGEFIFSNATGNVDNIDIGNFSDNGAIRIGSIGTEASFFVAGGISMVAKRSLVMHIW